MRTSLNVGGLGLIDRGSLRSLNMMSLGLLRVSAVVQPEPPSGGGGGTSKPNDRRVADLIDQQEAETARLARAALERVERQRPQSPTERDVSSPGQAEALRDAAKPQSNAAIPQQKPILPDITIPEAIVAKTETEFNAALEAAMLRSPASIIEPVKTPAIEADEMNIRLLLLLAT